MDQSEPVGREGRRNEWSTTSGPRRASTRSPIRATTNQMQESWVYSHDAPLAARRAVHLVQLLHVPLRHHLILQGEFRGKEGEFGGEEGEFGG
eukprot:8079297-Pyramimonas_sp.AAC.1